jgi:putative ABC transport system ATP-binding protein
MGDLIEHGPQSRDSGCNAHAGSAVLEVSGLAKAYRLGHRTLPVLESIDLRVQPGELVVIMGPSGSGKSTLLNCLAGIDAPDHGSVALAGDTLDYASESARIHLRRERIGIVFQFFNLIPTLSVHENVLLPLMIRGRTTAADRGRAEALLERVGLIGRSQHFPSQLSGGEMQLVSIARGLIHRPELLLADEPTGNVNPRIALGILETLTDTAAAAGTAVVMVTHSAEHAAWADRVCFLKEGRIADVLIQGRRRDDVAPVHERLLALGI